MKNGEYVWSWVVAQGVLRARARRGMTHQEFARFLKVKERLVHCLENEHRIPEHTSRAHLFRIGQEIEMSVQKVVYDTDHPDLRSMAKMCEIVTPPTPIPRTRGDCLTRERRTHLRVINGTPITKADDFRTDGVNCHRPCPWVRCAHHTYLEVVGTTKKVKVELNFPEFGPEDMAEMSPAELAGLAENDPDSFAELPRSRKVHSCSLDVADYRRFSSLEEVGEALNLTPERIRQVGTVACSRVEEELLLDHGTLKF